MQSKIILITCTNIPIEVLSIVVVGVLGPIVFYWAPSICLLEDKVQIIRFGLVNWHEWILLKCTKHFQIICNFCMLVQLLMYIKICEVASTSLRQNQLWFISSYVCQGATFINSLSWSGKYSTVCEPRNRMKQNLLTSLCSSKE